MSLLKGDLILLKIGGVLLGAQIEGSTGISADMLDKTNKDAPGVKAFIAGESGWTIQTGALYDPAAGEGFSEALGYIKNGTEVEITHGDHTGVYWAGSALIQNIDCSGPKNEIGSYSLDLQGTGTHGSGNLLTNCGFDGTTDWLDGNADGTADDWLQSHGAGTPAIVTGNGFDGNAQRVNHVTGTTTQMRYSTGVNAENGQDYRITGVFRAGAVNWRMYLRTTSDVFTNNMGVNAGDATPFLEDITATGTTEIVMNFYKIAAEPNDYLEIDYLRLWKIS